MPAIPMTTAAIESTTTLGKDVMFESLAGLAAALPW